MCSFQILSKLKKVLDLNVHGTKTQALLFLSNIAKEFSNQKNSRFTTNKIFAVVLTIFNSLLKDPGPILIQKILEIFEVFIKNVRFEALVHDIINCNGWLEPMLSEYLQRQVDNPSLTAHQYFHMQGKEEFEVKWLCVSTSDAKGEDALSSIIRRIYGDVAELERICESKSLTEENAATLHCIYNKLQRRLR